jgi:hypothetical protein
MKLSEIQQKMNFKVFTSEIFDKDVSGIYISDMVSEVMASAQAGNLLITIQTHKNVLAAANLVDVSGIIFINGKEPDQQVIDLANKAKVSLFGTSENGWQLAGKFYELGLR